jgi:acetyltransferase-like isoleucine patch superfamily enzyme
MKKMMFKIAVYCLPDCLWKFKSILLKRMFMRCGKNVIIGSGSTILHPEKIKMSDDIYMGQNFYVSVIEELQIGNRVMFGPQCSIIGGDHSYNDPLDNMRFTKKLGDNRTIVIEDDVWIGFGTLILKKAYIAEGSIIGARSVVNCKIEPYCVYVGTPAKKIKPRFDTYDDLQTYLKMMQDTYSFKSKYTEKELKRIYE